MLRLEEEKNNFCRLGVKIESESLIWTGDGLFVYYNNIHLSVALIACKLQSQIIK